MAFSNGTGRFSGAAEKTPPSRSTTNECTSPFRKETFKSQSKTISSVQVAVFGGVCQYFERYGLFIDMLTACWRAAPPLVPKPGSKTCSMLAVDPQPVHSTTIKESWSLPNLNSDIQDFAGSSGFASMDFVSGYWRVPAHNDFNTTCGVVAPKIVTTFKRVLPRLAKATSYFQSTVDCLPSSEQT